MNPRCRYFLNNISKYCGDLSNKRVLEVGADKSGVLSQEILNQLNALEVVGVNPAISNEIHTAHLSLIKSDAAQLACQDGYFDVILSSAVFEHVHDLTGVLKELYRVCN
jgi:ubiquinone/menaquinone biosynthesis C-methylase UbiE